MLGEIITIMTVFGTIFGVIYLFFSTRHRERMSLIEKGADANIFVAGRKRKHSLLTLFVLNVGLLGMGIGLGLFIAEILRVNLNISQEVAYPGGIILFAGIGLLIGFFITKKLDEE